jgi:glycine betaine/proline transport system ATP-binding protein
VMREARLELRLDERPADVLRRLGRAEATGAYVLDDDRRILGVVEDDWLARAAATGAGSISREGLVGEYLTTEPDRLLIDIVDQVGRHVVPLAVVDEERRLLGVVPRAAVLASLAAVPSRS